MIVKQDRTLKNGRRLVTVELAPNEQMAWRAFDPKGFYRLAHGLGDVIQGNHIVDADRVYWDSVDQEWTA